MGRRDLDELTDRERAVLALLRRDFTNEQIAQRLGISLDGAKYHVSQILSKLGVATREEAAAWRADERRAAWWGKWPAWAKVGPAAAAVFAALAVLGVLAIGWDGGSREWDSSLPEVAQAESGDRGSRQASPRPASSPTATEVAEPAISPAATATPRTAAADAPTVPRATPESPTPRGTPEPTPAPVSTPTCHGPDYQGMSPWGCVQPGDCAQPHVALSLDKAVYRPGEGISVTVDLSNDSSESIILCYLSGQDFEIFIYNAGAEITNYSREEWAAYTASLENHQVLPGWKQTFYWTNWDQIVGAPYEQGSPLAPGTYEARGVSTASCNVSSSPADCAGSPPVQFVVEP